MVSVVEGVGADFDVTTENSEITLKNFIQSPIVTEYLKNPDDAALAAKAQAYRRDACNQRKYE